jgi:hypothetical protein
MAFGIEFSSDEGIVARKIEHESPGHYIGISAPWQGEPNLFVADTYKQAKAEAAEFLENQIAYFQDLLADLRSVRRSDVQ